MVGDGYCGGGPVTVVEAVIVAGGRSPVWRRSLWWGAGHLCGGGHCGG